MLTIRLQHIQALRDAGHRVRYISVTPLESEHAEVLRALKQLQVTSPRHTTHVFLR